MAPPGHLWSGILSIGKLAVAFQPFFHYPLQQDGPCAAGAARDLLLAARARLKDIPVDGHDDLHANDLLMQAAQLCPREALLLDEVGEALRYMGRREQALDLYRWASGNGVWRHPLQRILVDFKPDLESAAIFGEEEFVHFPQLLHLKQLAENILPQLSAEFRAKRLKMVKSTRYGANFCPEEKCWLKSTYPKVFRWWRGGWAHYRYNCPNNDFPGACSLQTAVESSGGRLKFLNIAVTEVHPPETHIPLHRSKLQERLRMLCPIMWPNRSKSVLTFPGVASIEYEQGKCIWFDESYEHELHHTGGLRASLLLDVAHPALEGLAKQTA